MPDIHQEISFNAAPAEVYKALTDPTAFAEFTGDPARIDPQAGGAFMCFGTFVLGRNVELVENTRIVQAWRVFNWPEGVYSIVRFELIDNGGATTLVMDHTGVPDDQAAHVDMGWGHKYWEPLRAYLES